MTFWGTSNFMTFVGMWILFVFVFFVCLVVMMRVYINQMLKSWQDWERADWRQQFMTVKCVSPLPSGVPSYVWALVVAYQPPLVEFHASYLWARCWLSLLATGLASLPTPAAALPVWEAGQVTGMVPYISSYPGLKWMWVLFNAIPSFILHLPRKCDFYWTLGLNS